MFGTSTKRIISIVCVLIVISFIVLGILFFMIKQSSEKISTYETQQNQMNAQLESDRSLRLFLETSEQDIERLSSRILPKDGTVAFIELIEKLARDNKLFIEVGSVKITEAPTQKETFEVLTLTLSTKGSWEGTYRFLSLLETLPYKTLISSVGVTAEGKESEKSSNVLWNGAFSFSVIKYKE